MNHRRPGFTMIELLVVITIITVLIALLLPAVQAARGAARRCQCTNNLMEIGIALDGYEATNNVLPPGSVDAIGPVVATPTSYQFGWIAQILPYLDQKAVYRHLDFNVGVYHLANQTACDVKLNVLACPASVSSGDNYAANHNDVEAPINAQDRGVFFLNSRVRLDEIDDGLAHTIFVGEKMSGGSDSGWAVGTRATLRNTGTAINQTSESSTYNSPYQASLFNGASPSSRPNAAPLQADEIPPEAMPASTGPAFTGGYGSHHGLGANFLFGDGSVRYVRSNVSLVVYRLLGNRSDGQVLGDNQF